MKIERHFSFIVLHYMATYETMECIESILKNIKHQNFSIIVVDNKSPDNSGKILLEKYKDYDNVDIILNDTNLGFAKGNNVGIQHAYRKYKSDFYICINNDIIIEQNNFLNKIEKFYEQHAFDFLGPDIISLKNGEHQNPFKGIELSEKILKQKIFLLYLYLFLNTIHLEGAAFFKLLRAVIKNDDNNYCKEDNNTAKAGIKLHGSCIIFSKHYIEKFGGFYPDTFMFLEEEFLFFIAKKEKLKIYYYPELKVYHKEDSSTDIVYKKKRLKDRFVYKNTIRSMKALLKLMKTYE